LGLALVAAIAQLHHARIMLADASPGLSVRITFPLD
jgi:signal transduction histidine kinase